MKDISSFLEKFEDKSLKDIRNHFLVKSTHNIQSISILGDFLNEFEKYLTYKIKTYERHIVKSEVDAVKDTSLKLEFERYMKKEMLFSRRCRYYTNRQWDSWRLYKETNDEKYKVKYDYYELKVEQLTSIKDSVLSRTEWKLFENKSFRKINLIDIETYKFTKEFIEFGDLDPFLLKLESEIIKMFKLF